MKKTLLKVVPVIALGILPIGFGANIASASTHQNIQKGVVSKVETHPTLYKGIDSSNITYYHAVMDLQDYLNVAGYKTAVDGIFGSKTQNQVKAFQAAHNLKTDGIVGPKTWAALEANLK
ncbi:peptidoglycan-binding protein [Priestia megaterium]|uniref:peptidoglycan-binding domain-containing protein n=1 Tax=Priestia megaterium TaxID=1404 RepID=UPI001C8E6537|nr:peptidoglycan-binding domain-containing protein [Priestia megaterium]MBY0200212.1 peptidoglycan-binding protein [Priestia megaterium]